MGPDSSSAFPPYLHSDKDNKSKCTLSPHCVSATMLIALYLPIHPCYSPTRLIEFTFLEIRIEGLLDSKQFARYHTAIERAGI